MIDRAARELLRECEAAFLALESAGKARAHMNAKGIKLQAMRTNTFVLRNHMALKIAEFLGPYGGGGRATQ